jgi:hypothetical protein
MCSGDTHDGQHRHRDALAAKAASQGAELLCLPEVAGLMNRNGAVARTQVVDAGRMTRSSPPAGSLPRRHGLWIHIGSTPVLAPDGRFLNHSAVIDDEGAIRATYDKVHLFDVAIEGQAPDRRVQALRPGRGRRGPRHALGPLGPVDLLRPALPPFLPPLRTGRRQPHLHPVGLHRPHRSRPLGGPDPRPRHRDRRLRPLPRRRRGSMPTGARHGDTRWPSIPGGRSWPISGGRRRASR